jgi:hypothetical protein
MFRPWRPETLNAVLSLKRPVFIEHEIIAILGAVTRQEGRATGPWLSMRLHSIHIQTALSGSETQSSQSSSFRGPCESLHR